MPRQIFQLRVSLADVRPSVWRRVLVPGGYPLDRMYRVVQLAPGWQDCHLHWFEVHSVQYAPPDPDERYPLCADGAGCCPSEDVGGPAGYAEFRAALADPAHPEREVMREWIGRRFDGAAFDPARATVLLRRLA